MADETTVTEAAVAVPAVPKEATTTVDLSTLTADQLLAMEETELAEAKDAFKTLQKEVTDVGNVFATYARAKIKTWLKDKVTAAATYLWSHKNTIAMWAAIMALLAKAFGWL